MSFGAGPPVPIGKRGEPRVTELVIELLERAGHSTTTQPSNDARGEDARLLVDDVPHTLQITGIPGAAPFWAAAAHGSTSTQVTTAKAAEWLEYGIAEKARSSDPAELATTILALDVHEWGDRLAGRDVVSKLFRQGQSPAQRYGLAGVAIVGDRLSNSTWFGA